MKDNLHRLNSPKMVNYHYLYRNSIRWNGDRPLKGKKVILYGEQGCGDVIQFLRYVPYLLKQKCELYIHAQPALRRLVEYNFKISGWINKEEGECIPDHDYHILALSLPFILGFIPTAPYLKVNDEPLQGFEEKIKVGIAWEGNPGHTNNFERSCPLKWFKSLMSENTEFFMIQQKPNLNWFLKDAEDFPLLSIEQKDFLDTARLIRQMDYVVSVDTAALHVAGAIGVKSYGMMSHYHDPRWTVGNWYPSVKVMKQPSCDNWKDLFEKTKSIIENKRYDYIVPNKEKIVITGGIGDFLALYYQMNTEFKRNLKKIYLATRAHESIKELCLTLFPQQEIEVIWEEFHKLDAFDRKGQITEAFAHYYEKSGIDLCPTDWHEVEDYSIQIQFQEVIKNQKVIDWHEARKEEGKFALVCPNSKNCYNRGRNFDERDWKNTIDWLEAWGLEGVVIGLNNEDIPKHKSLIDMTNISILDSFNLALMADAYIGIDSWASVVVTKHLRNRMWVKSISEHLKEFLGIYYAPQPGNDFVVEKIPEVGNIESN